jgi:hypothetical protein
MALQADAPNVASNLVESAVVNIGPHWCLFSPTMTIQRDCRPFGDSIGTSSRRWGRGTTARMHPQVPGAPGMARRPFLDRQEAACSGPGYRHRREEV